MKAEEPWPFLFYFFISFWERASLFSLSWPQTFNPLLPIATSGIPGVRWHSCLYRLNLVGNRARPRKNPWVRSALNLDTLLSRVIVASLCYPWVTSQLPLWERVVASHRDRLNGVNGLGPVRVLTRSYIQSRRTAFLGIYLLLLPSPCGSLLSFTHSEQGAQHAGSTAWLLARNGMSKAYSVSQKNMAYCGRQMHGRWGQGSAPEMWPK